MSAFIQEYFKKYVVIFYGLVIQAVAIAMMYLGGIGSGPFPVMVQGLARILGTSEGVANYAISGACIFIAFIYNRKFITINTILTAVGFSLLLDPAISLMSMVMPEVITLPMKVVFTITATVLIGVGIGVILSANGGAGALECLELGINDRTGISFVALNWMFNISFIILGFLLGGEIGPATVTITIFLGGIIKVTTGVCSKTFIRWLGMDGLEVID